MTTESQQIRKCFLSKRASLPLTTQQQASAKALLHWQSSRLPVARTIAAFWSVKGELPTQPLLDWLLENRKSTLLPKLCPEVKGSLYFAEYNNSTPLITDRYGIPSPDVPPNQAFPIEKIDIIIMPLVATDTKGNRIGMGKGYYDKTLSSIRDTRPAPLLIGWCYSWQVLENELKPAPWDIPIDGIITEKGGQWFNSKSINTYLDNINESL